jgi:bifunctional DNase/RNase
MSRKAAASISTDLTEVEVQIRGLMLDPVTNMPIVVLKDIAGDTVLPIWVGVFEANAIALELEKTATPRPMTHDLLRNLARGLNAAVTKVVVSDLRDDTFYATIWMQHAVEAGGLGERQEQVTLDARPSDAIALALRWDCPIYVARKVLDHAQLTATETSANVNPDELRRWLEGLNDEDTGRYKM